MKLILLGICRSSQNSNSLYHIFQVYQANSDQNSVVVNTLEAPIEARFVRLHPQRWYGHISLRMELYGCSLKSGRALIEFTTDNTCKDLPWRDSTDSIECHNRFNRIVAEIHKPVLSNRANKKSHKFNLLCQKLWYRKS